MNTITAILEKKEWNHSDLVDLLNASKDDARLLFDYAGQVRDTHVGNKVFIRGLIEVANYCAKNCFYCGLRHSNDQILRYQMDDKDVLDTVRYAWDQGFHSVVFQSGEITSRPFVRYIDKLLRDTAQITNGRMAVTLSCGEQDEETYKRWFESGSTRYLIRIETSNRALFRRIHPDNVMHNFDRRIEALHALRRTGYHTGTGVMIGLPFQTIESLASDILFMKEMDIDMVGMGPYLEQRQTPLYAYQSLLQPQPERLFLALKMIAVLRIVMKDINIAAATALQVIDPDGRELALGCGANVIMPDLTPAWAKRNYLLYDNKPNLSLDASEIINKFNESVIKHGLQVAWNERGDSVHFLHRTTRFNSGLTESY